MSGCRREYGEHDDEDDVDEGGGGEGGCMAKPTVTPLRATREIDLKHAATTTCCCRRRVDAAAARAGCGRAGAAPPHNID